MSFILIYCMLCLFNFIIYCGMCTNKTPLTILKLEINMLDIFVLLKRGCSFSIEDFIILMCCVVFSTLKTEYLGNRRSKFNKHFALSVDMLFLLVLMILNCKNFHIPIGTSYLSPPPPPPRKIMVRARVNPNNPNPSPNHNFSGG